ncbi:MAG: glycerate kinase [Jatrophihabitantaceae bacterium]
MHVLIAPDKFKGSLTAAQVADAVSAGLRAERPDVVLVRVLVADGGDGTVDAAVAAGFERVPVTAAGPTGLPVRSSYARRGSVAVVELAGVCGLSRLPGCEFDPLGASSYGVGEVIRAALDAGAHRIVLGIGGSASTDGGAGLLQALGARILDAHGDPLGRGGGVLGAAATLDLSELHLGLRAVQLAVASDVDNPLTGPDGAAAVYGPQKGADPDQVRALDDALRQWAAVVASAVGTDHSGEPGAGAAGGVGVAALALGAQLSSGIDLVLDLVGFDAALGGADLVITGEGSLDRQTLSGKAPAGVAAAARRAGVAVVAVAGRCSLSPDELSGAGFGAVYALTDLEPDVERCIADAPALLEQLGRKLAGRLPRCATSGCPTPPEVAQSGAERSR